MAATKANRPTDDCRVKHGMNSTPEYRAWQKMKDRCYNPNSQRYDRYGARGIRICERWRNSFVAFLEDMGSRPSPEHSIERKDNNGHYEPDNCKWGTREEQNRNKTVNVYLEHDGKRMILADWARELGIGPKTLEWRLQNWSLADALTRTVEPRSWNDTDRQAFKANGWTRKRPLTPLSTVAIQALSSLAGRNWTSPSDIDAPSACSRHKSLQALAKRGLVETQRVGGSARRALNHYRITQEGMGKLQAIAAESRQRLAAGLSGPPVPMVRRKGGAA